MFVDSGNYNLGRAFSPLSDGARIVNGMEATLGQFPHQLLLTTDTGHPICGAALITSVLALTAAHCVIGSLPSQIKIESGKHNLSVADGNVQKVGVKNVYVHEKYNNYPIGNDIALLVLSKELTMNRYTNAFFVPIENTLYEHTATVSGWGRTKEGGRISDVLRWGEVEHIPLPKCRETYKPLNESVVDDMLCALGKKGEDACNMDSGGPLTCKGLKDGRTYLCGLVSWGVGCGRLPGVYTDVAKHSRWIKDKITTLIRPYILCKRDYRCCTIDYTPGHTPFVSNASLSSNSRQDKDDALPNSLCDDSEFYCSESDSCIHKAYRCDGAVDCHDDPSDEAGCNNRAEAEDNPCDENDFYCASSNSCYDSTLYSYDKVCSNGRNIHENVEPSSNPFSCNHGDFYCEQSNLCVPSSLRCNGNVDCNFEEDEVGCSTDYDVQRTDVDSSERTLSSSHCDINDWECWFSSANQRTEGTACQENYFRCASSSCIPNEYKCDGNYDCGDGDYTDEEDCPDDNRRTIDNAPKTVPDPISCNYGEFQCANSRNCIAATLRCNGDANCGFGDTSDEDGCEMRPAVPSESSCDENHYYCHLKNTCIHFDESCVNDYDSGYEDQRSEPEVSYNYVDSTHGRTLETENYGTQEYRPDDSNQEQVCSDGQFQCTNNACISYAYHCDGENDCEDGSDEHECPQF